MILLHGFPDDIHSFVEVTPLLAARGYRVIVPYMRGHGTTTFLSHSTPRDAQQAVMALDVLALMDALKISKALLVGYDLGSPLGRHHRGGTRISHTRTLSSASEPGHRG